MHSRDRLGERLGCPKSPPGAPLQQSQMLCCEASLGGGSVPRSHSRLLPHHAETRWGDPGPPGKLMTEVWWVCAQAQPRCLAASQLQLLRQA